MTSYIVAGTTLTVDGDAGTGNIDLADTLNPVTGGVGLETVRILNKGTAIATVGWTPHSTTYEFDSVAYTPNHSGIGASINITATYFGYQVAIANGGHGFIVGETLSVLGTAVGGTTTANDLVVTVTSVGTSGVLTGVITGATVAGTPQWPQSIVSELIVNLNSEEFVQVTGAPADGAYFTANNTDTGNVYVTPVDIVS